IPTIARTRTAAIAVIALVEVSHRIWASIHAQLLGHGVEDALVDLARRGIDTNLMPNTAQEGVIDQVLGIQVGRKDGQLFERYFKFLAGRQREEVMPAFQGKNPAVEQLFGTAQLPAEVVDEEDAAVGFHVQRGLVEVRLGIVAQIEHFQIQLTAGDDDGAARPNPAWVHRTRIQKSAYGRFVILHALVWRLLGKLMDRLIEDGDNTV